MLFRRVGIRGLGGSGKRGQMADALQQPKTVFTVMWESLRGLPDIWWISWIQDRLFCGVHQVKSVLLPLFVIWFLRAAISFELVVEGGERWPEWVSEGESVYGLSLGLVGCPKATLTERKEQRFHVAGTKATGLQLKTYSLARGLCRGSPLGFRGHTQATLSVCDSFSLTWRQLALMSQLPHIIANEENLVSSRGHVTRLWLRKAPKAWMRPIPSPDSRDLEFILTVMGT